MSLFGVPASPGSSTNVPVATVQNAASEAAAQHAYFGGSPFDASVNAAAVSGTPLITIAANPNRAYIEIQNQSAGQIQVVRDDGSGTSGTVSSILLAGTGANMPGGDWSSRTFRGRIRVYGATGAQVAAFQE